MVGVQRSTAERDGKRLDVGNCIVFELKDGKVVDGREHFNDLYAWDEFWSYGLARAVLAGIAVFAREREAVELYLQVERDNLPARALYASAGFLAYAYHYRRLEPRGVSPRAAGIRSRRAEGPVDVPCPTYGPAPDARRGVHLASERTDP